MSTNSKILSATLALSTIIFATNAVAQQPSAAGENKESILFKVHDVTPEKDADGHILHCNIGATFFNRTPQDIANISLTLTWNDDTIEEVIRQEERSAKEQRRSNPKGNHSRYSTAGFTSKTVNASLKLPPIKSMQQVTLKSKVDTNRCFLLLEEMEVNVSNCGTLNMGDKASSQNCKNIFRYVDPKMEEYYLEFKEVSLQDQLAIEDEKYNGTLAEMQKKYSKTLETIQSITNDATANQQ